GVCFCLFSFSQGEGMHFVRGMTWQRILAKAKKENKYIFVDCYTTWCGPCKYMAKNVFPLKQTGDSVNPDYICVGMQIDSTDLDSDTIKLAYPDARMISINYDIRAYPTFLYFNPDGKLVHRTVGSTVNAAQFISYTKDARNPERQYYSMITSFRSGNRDTLMLESLANLAIQNDNGFLADSVIRQWLTLIKNVFTAERLQMIAQVLIKPGNPQFDLFYHNAEKIDRIVKPDYAEYLVMNAIIRQNEAIIGALNNPASEAPDWNKVYTEISAKYGAVYAHRIVVSIKPVYFKRAKNWDLYAKSLIAYLKEFGSHLDPLDLNNYAWDIFEYCATPEDLNYGLSISERSLNKEKPEPASLDTYANLLYKLGRKTEAISKETEALALADLADKKSYQETLDKMKAGVKTWD
ncbi:MAG: thioredoxin domain-containing protein, partial [Flavisolibacter sp.]